MPEIGDCIDDLFFLEERCIESPCQMIFVRVKASLWKLRWFMFMLCACIRRKSPKPTDSWCCTRPMSTTTHATRHKHKRQSSPYPQTVPNPTRRPLNQWQRMTKWSPMVPIRTLHRSRALSSHCITKTTIHFSLFAPCNAGLKFRTGEILPWKKQSTCITAELNWLGLSLDWISNDDRIAIQQWNHSR